MKPWWIALSLLAVVSSMSGCGGTRSSRTGEPGSPTAAIEPADLGSFREALEPYGDWVPDSPYGTVWIPYALPAGWRPYTTGRWLSTDHGWMWLEEEPWGWAAFHYGRWAFDERLGWVWVPANTWAPAWVAWRHGQGYIGWAPLAPGVDWNGKPDGLARDLDPSAWSFVRTREFGSIDVASSVLPVGRNVTLLPLTTNVARYAPRGTRVAEQGFSESGTVERTRRYRVTDAVRYRQNRAAIVQGSSVEIFRPEAIPKQPSAEEGSPSRRPPGVRAQEIAERERREQTRFEERMTRERERLRREQEREARQRPENMSESRLLRRQKEETEAQDRFQKREKAIMDSRRERLRASQGR